MGKNTKGTKVENKIAAIILKFKDKRTEDTIEAHVEILNKEKTVWWGWWSKDYENLPQNQLEEIKQRLANNRDAVKIYLFHSKKEIFYRAVCEEIVFRENGLQLQCPDENCPEYYKDYPVRAWFRFSDIHPTNKEDFCGKYTYLADDLIDEEHKKKPSLSSFAGSKASEPDLFVIQKRTMWFLRNVRKADNHIDMNMFGTMMENISKNYFKTLGNRILLLSDLHFTEIEQRHAFGLGDNPDKMKLIDCIKKALKKDERPISGVIISGDFTWCANEKEFSYAEQFILDLMENYDIKRNQILIVPGNHDIAFEKDRSGEFTENRKIEVASKEAQANYIDFYNSIFEVRPKEEFLCASRRILLRNNLPIEIIGLDSNVLQQEEKAFVGQGFVGYKQLNYLSTQMELKDNEEVYSYRILVLHHHIMPAWYQEEVEKNHSYSVLLDSGRVQEFIKKYRIKLVIHGHNHENQFTKITIPSVEDSTEQDYVYYIIGIGSAGACGNSNVIGVIDFDKIGKVKYTNLGINSKGQDDLQQKKYEFPLNGL